MEQKRALKKLFTSAKGGVWIIAFVVIFIVALFASKVSSANVAPEPTPAHSLDSSEEYSFINAQLITDCLAYSDEDKYYAVYDTSGVWRVVIISDSMFNGQLKQINEYTYNTDENAVSPEYIKITGISENTPEDVEKFVMEYFNITSASEYKNYFGEYMINAKRSYVSGAETLSTALALISGIAALVTGIYLLIRRAGLNKCLKRIESLGETEKAYNEVSFIDFNDKSFNGLHFTQNYAVNKSIGVIVRYEDMIWIFKRIQKYNFITVGEYLVVHTPFGQMNLTAGKTRKNMPDVNSLAADEIQKRVPDIMIGYTIENQQEAQRIAKEKKAV